MNKFFTKIAGLSLGLAMAIGVGVAVGSKEAKIASAADTTISLDFSSNAYGISTTQGNQTLTGDGATYGFEFAKGNGTGAKYNSGYVLFGKAGVYFRNTSAPSNSYISAISWTYSGGVSTNVQLSLSYGASALTAESSPITSFGKAAKNKTISLTATDTTKSYFFIYVTNAYNCQIVDFSVTWTPTGGGTTNHDLTYAVGTQGVYDGSTTKTFSVAESGTHTVKTPADVGITANTGYIFSTWNDGTSNYAPNSTYTMGTSNVTLTAQWVAGVGLSYNPVSSSGTGTGSMDTTYVVSGGTQTVATCTFAAPDGKQFDHWNTAANDGGTSYDPDDEIANFTSATTLYAIWVAKTSVTLDPTKQTSGTYMTGDNDAAKFEVSASEWNIVGDKCSSSNMPAFYNGNELRMYGKAGGNGGQITVTTLKAHRTITKIAIDFVASNGAKVYEGSTSGSEITASDGFYTFGENTTAFVLKNTNNGTTQVKFRAIEVYYHDEAVATPEINLTNTPSVVGIGTSTASFTVEYNALTAEFVVTTDTTYITASYTGATGTGTATVTLSGVAVINSTTITVSSTGAETQTFDVAVEVLPIVNANIDNVTWSGSAYSGSPHTLTWNSSYEFIASAGQFTSGSGYLGTNSNNSSISNVSDNSWTLSGSSIASALDGSWSTYGQALYMSNFGVVHPTKFTLNVGTLSGGQTPYSGTYYILGSADSGDSWSVLSTGSIALGDLTWTDSSSTYISNSDPIQFAFVTTSTKVGSVYNLAVKVWGDSYATTKVLDSIYVSGTPKTTYKVGEAFDLNGATVKAHYTDSTTYPDETVTSLCSFSEIAHGTTSVTITYMTVSTTVNVTVTDEGTVYKKVLSTDELIVGAKVIIGTSNGGYTAGAQGSTNKNRNSEAAGGSHGYYEDGDIENWSVNTTVFTIGKTETGYTFHDGTGYLYAASSSDNVLRVENELDENHNGEWSISIADGVATIVSQGEHTHSTMNGNGTAFSVYASPTVAISLYSDVAQTMLNGFGETYLHMTDYTSQSGYCSDNSHHYYLTAKEALVAMGSAYIDELQSNGALDAYQARYEAWARACGDTSPYAGSGIVKSSSLLSMMNSSKNVATTIAIIAISAVSLAAIGGYFLFRKKKED